MTAPITGPSGGAAAVRPPNGAEDVKLRNAARQLEGMFTEQLFKAMRATVPRDQGALGGGSGEEMFTGLLDERLASDPRAASTHGIGEAIYQHLLRSRGAQSRLPQDAAATDGTMNSVTATGRGTSLGTTPRPARAPRS